MTSGSVKVEDIGIPMYLTVALVGGLNASVLDSHGYNSLYHFFMGFVGSPISYKDGCKWTGSKNSTIKGRLSKLSSKHYTINCKLEILDTPLT